MNHSTLRNIEADAARYGFFKVTSHHGGNRKIAWKIKCSHCPREFTSYWLGAMTPEAMGRNMRVRGWDVGKGDRPLCPDCSHPHTDKHPKDAPKGQSNDRYIPPETATVAALEKAVAKKYVALVEEVAGAKLPKDIAARIPMVVAHVKATEPHLHDLKNGAAISAIAKETKVSGYVGTLRPPTDLAPPPAPIKRGPGRPKKQVDYGHEFDGRVYAKQPDEVRVAETTVDDEANEMNPNSNPTPKPKIAHAVFQELDAVFDSETRLYKSGYTDQRVATDCGTSEEVVAFLRRETFGELAEDPRITGLREDLELARMEMTDVLKKMNALYDALASRIEQIVATTKSR